MLRWCARAAAGSAVLPTLTDTCLRHRRRSQARPNSLRRSVNRASAGRRIDPSHLAGFLARCGLRARRGCRSRRLPARYGRAAGGMRGYSSIASPSPTCPTTDDDEGIPPVLPRRIAASLGCATRQWRDFRRRQPISLFRCEPRFASSHCRKVDNNSLLSTISGIVLVLIVSVCQYGS